jgi:hypothetical protein
MECKPYAVRNTAFRSTCATDAGGKETKAVSRVEDRKERGDREKEGVTRHRKLPYPLAIIIIIVITIDTASIFL